MAGFKLPLLGSDEKWRAVWIIGDVKMDLARA